MRWVISTCLLAAFYTTALSQTTTTGFIFGRHTYFDFGPPTDYYELLVVNEVPAGSFIERITLTPAVDACFVPAKVETTSASISKSPADLLGSGNLCAISERDLHRELKRCKHCMNFSGVNVALQVQCGPHVRIIRSDILDKDMFDPRANTPKHTSWTTQLLAQLDAALGPGVMDKPMFSYLNANDEPADAQPNTNKAALRELSEARYDALFQGAPDKPSDLYRAAQVPAAVPTVSLESSEPFSPTSATLPQYPPIARLAHIEGSVTFRLTVDNSGGVTDLSVDGGLPLLQGVAKNAAQTWKFPKQAVGTRVRAKMIFSLNCHTPKPSN